jgi:hypothetical protein
MIDETGRFWWSDEPFTERQFAPDSSVTGALKISDDGIAELTLDGFLSGEADQHFLRNLMVARGEPTGRPIQGILKGSGKRVLLLDPRRAGGHLSNVGMSYEGYIAFEMLIGEARFTDKAVTSVFSLAEIDLAPLNDWLGYKTIKIEQTENSLRATYDRPEAMKYSGRDRTIEIRSELVAPRYLLKRTNDLSAQESTRLRMSWPNTVPLKDAQHELVLLQDFLFLFTGGLSRFDWPILSNQGEPKYRFISARDDHRRTELDKRDWWFSFSDVKDDFGNLFESWKEHQEKYGPGFYLYLGNYRLRQMYAEHRFVNLMWAVESFHRTKNPEIRNAGVAEKRDRIVAAVFGEKDRKWLEKRLRNADELSLEDRIVDTFKTLPIEMEPRSLRDFAQKCARYRNDLSHFGGSRDTPNYQDFLRKLDELSDALGSLHHAVILNEIGVESDTLRRCLHEGYHGSRFQRTLKDAGIELSAAKPV